MNIGKAGLYCDRCEQPITDNNYTHKNSFNFHKECPNSKKDPKEESLSPIDQPSNNTFDTTSIASFESLIEQLAAIEHERWADWQKWVHSVCQRNEDGSLVLPAPLLQRWERQIATKYDDLPAEEKQSDRDQVMRYWPLILTAFQRLVERVWPTPRGSMRQIPCPDNKQGCLVYHQGFVATEYDKGYNQALEDFAEALKKEIGK